jgi:FixJ family two-component response regulator
MVSSSLISIVDDDHSVRESLESLIRSIGYTVKVFASAEEFLASPDLTRTECLLLDIHMPGMDGVTLRRHLKGEYPEIPVIFITAHGSEDDARARTLREDAVDSLLKPLNEDAVLAAVQAALTAKGGATGGAGPRGVASKGGNSNQ